MLTPKISIIVPVYNVQDYLEECLDSVINQTFKDIEIICINDGSTDDSLTILKKYRNFDKRITIIDQKNCGLGAARNVGVKYATGNYLMFVDSDDWLDLRAGEVLYKIAEEHKLEVIEGEFETIPNNSRKIYKSYPDRYAHTVLTGKQFAQIAYPFTVGTVSRMYRKDFFLENELFNIEGGWYYEDNITALKTTYYARRYMYIPYKFYKRRVRDNSITQEVKGEKHKNSYMAVLNDLGEFLDEKAIWNVPCYSFYILGIMDALRKNFSADLVTQDFLKRKKNEIRKKMTIKAILKLSGSRPLYYLLPCGVFKLLKTIIKIKANMRFL